MNELQKFFRILNPKEKKAMEMLFAQIRKDFKKVPHLQAYRGKRNWYRVRAGRYRVVFSIERNNRIVLRKAAKRDENTYKNL